MATVSLLIIDGTGSQDECDAAKCHWPYFSVQ